MKLSTIIILFLLTGCSGLIKRGEAPKPPRTITEKLNDCITLRINEGVKPELALTICDTIYRGRP